MNQGFENETEDCNNPQVDNHIPNQPQSVAPTDQFPSSPNYQQNQNTIPHAKGNKRLIFLIPVLMLLIIGAIFATNYRKIYNWYNRASVTIKISDPVNFPSGVDVKLISLNDSKIDKKGKTDKAGTLEFFGLVKGDYTITTEYFNYNKLNEKITLKKGSNNFDFKLTMTSQINTEPGPITIKTSDGKSDFMSFVLPDGWTSDSNHWMILIYADQNDSTKRLITSTPYESGMAVSNQELNVYDTRLKMDVPYDQVLIEEKTFGNSRYRCLGKSTIASRTNVSCMVLFNNNSVSVQYNLITDKDHYQSDLNIFYNAIESSKVL